MAFAFRMYYRALRRLMWAKLGDLRHPPTPSRAIRNCLKQTYGETGMLVEGGAFGYPGWIVKTNDELGFLFREGKQVTIRAFPFEALLESRIQRMVFYDYLHLVTRSERVTLRVFRSNRDMAQELFNEIQAVMAGRAAQKMPPPEPAATRPETAPSNAQV